jgi:hypothetical protein
VENRQKNGILTKINDNDFFLKKCVFPTADTQKVVLTPTSNHLSHCSALCCQISSMGVFRAARRLQRILEVNPKKISKKNSKLWPKKDV